LAIDRCFTLSGAGLIVTGTVFSGAVAAGEQIRVLQAGLSARIRSIHAQKHLRNAAEQASGAH
jgi:selenocysteine-specific elongation factor